jgi:regulator of cell morphogenesis and NO signaling
MKMVDVIHHDYRLIPVINRFGIEFGFGNHTVAEVCQSYNINTNFFLEIISSFSDVDFFPNTELQTYPFDVLIDYLRKTHKFYLDEKVPEIQAYIKEMLGKVSTKNVENVHLISNFFQGYTEELARHLNYEEQCVFPYVQMLEEILEKGFLAEDNDEKLKSYSIDLYERNHDSLEVKLGDLKNLLIKYLHPDTCKSICRRILIELYRLESDIENHTLLEERVLIPKVKELEIKVLMLKE